ncbi:MAG: GatB/YqeY domain-containing protein [Candidatus Saccharimonadales bacterium]
MTLKERIQNDMKAALLGGNRFEGEVLRNLKAAILNEEVNSGRRDEGLGDDDVETLIAREVKKRKESIALYEQNDRAELAKNEQDEIDVLKTYLPEELGEDDIRQLVQAVIAETGASSPQQMGQVIGAVKAKAGTAADGAMVARITKEELTK